MKDTLRATAALLIVLTAAHFVLAQNPFQSHIRPTKWLSPEEEQATFTLPPGFEIQLFASEPDILKPLNMAFDAKGRMWLTDSTEYPHPVAEGEQGRDTVKILEDTTGDGKADKITTFADGLNIPIGIYPYRDGAVVWSIPNIWFIRDTDGDGKADKREKLYGPFGWQRDTHGMNNGFTRGFDGWLYACHGFNNHTTVKGADGHEITMQSGNTYRMRLDGSRIEHFTHGQVNPFGMTITEFGDLITADCHSKPLYLLMRDGYYPSFGKPHDGLGFVPPIMTHSHGSTALCGPAYYAGENFPNEFRGNVFVGNVMTSRVNRNKLEWHGSTPVAVEQPDLVSTTDPWFRPVDIQMGPDGAVYVADFYNKIIGHYEVPLDHPERDRTSGRIWRIVYTGEAEESKPAVRKPDLTKASSEELIAALGSENLTYRLLALNYVADHKIKELRGMLKEYLNDGRQLSGPRAAAVITLLERSEPLTHKVMEQFEFEEPLQEFNVRMIQILSEHDAIDKDEIGLGLLSLMPDEDYRGIPQRNIAASLARHPNVAYIPGLLEAIKKCPNDDALLKHQLRLALRNHLKLEGALSKLDMGSLDSDLAKATAETALGIESPAAGQCLAEYLIAFPQTDPKLAADYATHAARFADVVDLHQLATKLPQKLAERPLSQLLILRGIGNGLQQCGCKPGPAAQEWVAAAVKQTLAGERATITWTAEPIAGKPHRADMFVVEKRASNDGNNDQRFFGSLPRGESMCGIYRSGEFKLPQELSFFAAGHNGYPDAKDRTENFIRLREAGTGKLLREAPPPRHDVARKITWKLEDLARKRGYLEIVDADSSKAYAWLAVGRFSLPQLNPSSQPEQLQLAAELVGDWAVPGCEPLLENQLALAHDSITSAALAEALLNSAAADVRLKALAGLIGGSVSRSVRAEIIAAVIDREEAKTLEAISAVMRSSPAEVQQRLAEELASTPLGSRTLVEAIEAGKASPRLLTRPTVKQKLATLDDEQLASRIDKLTAGLPPANSEIATRIDHVRQAYVASATDLSRGAAVFKKQCAICHKIGNEGEMIGPQLDGIGNRGLDRVLEDLLDPHRNVDIQFRTTTLAMTDGRVLSGLVRERDGGMLEVVDSQGKKITVKANDVDQRKASPLSLMPDNMVDKLKPQELNDLLRFLTSQTGG